MKEATIQENNIKNHSETQNRTVILKEIVHINTIFVYMKSNQIYNLYQPVY